MKERFTRQDRKASLMRGMQVGLIQNTTPDYHSVMPNMQVTSPNQEEQAPQLKTVTLLQLRPFDNNPRKTRNPKFEEIKESIRVRGLDFPPNITQRPGEEYYIIADGGNTRLQALQELYEETQDPKYFSITCLYKPWQGNNNDGITGELHCLIGHLAENDLRGDLSFIERALGIQQAKKFYEQQLSTSLSHRKLSERLKADGYSISYSLLAKMEQCIELLYPAIPNILLSGMGKPQIEKLLQLFSNANTYWEKHTPLFHKHDQDNNQDPGFKALWLETLALFDNDDFSLDIFQDELIGNMVNAIGSDYVSYQDILFELDNKPKSHDSDTYRTAPVKQDNVNSETEISMFVATEKSQNSTSTSDNVKTSIPDNVQIIEDKKDNNIHQLHDKATQLNEQKLDSVSSGNSEQKSNSTASDNFSEAENIDSTFDIFEQFGIAPGKSINEQRQQRAEQNGIAFANTGCQPVDDIWQIYPAFDTPEKLRFEAYGLATDIAKLAHLQNIVIPTESDEKFSFTIAPLASSIQDELTISVHALLACLACDNHNEPLTVTLSESLLIGFNNQPEISDLLLVKLFRLIRVIRQLRTHLRS
ncbi:ParB family protein [Gallibacterium genomosp. 3]|uniref:Chromosomal partitioning protein ParB n=1 Tax=Gallibacterium genomosp. 3 TaxID=505345 RepID=A0A1A7PQV2_9PAST|nr:ParB family protein [Gallibacterium genomosp. 3]OBX04948.1 chromosomal partitioning protein ParB [Gallibacterium genomosp. 3]